MQAIVQTFVCPRCAAPLPPDVASTPRCGYCGAGILVRSGRLEATRAARGAPLDLDPVPFMTAVARAVDRGVPPADAIRQAAREHLGVLGKRDVVARLTLAIAREFDREHPEAPVGHDGIALIRIAQGYVKALPSLRASGKAELTLPFLSASPSGVAHLQMTLTPTKIAKLLADASR